VRYPPLSLAVEKERARQRSREAAALPPRTEAYNAGQQRIGAGSHATHWAMDVGPEGAQSRGAAPGDRQAAHQMGARQAPHLIAVAQAARLLNFPTPARACLRAQLRGIPGSISTCLSRLRDATSGAATANSPRTPNSCAQALIWQPGPDVDVPGYLRRQRHLRHGPTPPPPPLGWT